MTLLEELQPNTLVRGISMRCSVVEGLLIAQMEGRYFFPQPKKPSPTKRRFDEEGLAVMLGQTDHDLEKQAAL